MPSAQDGQDRISSSSWRELGSPDSNGNAVQIQNFYSSSNPISTPLDQADEAQTSSIHSKQEQTTANNSQSSSRDNLKTGMISNEGPSFIRNLNEMLGRIHVESTGIIPIPLEQRVERNWYSVGLLWFSANTNVSGIVMMTIDGYDSKKIMFQEVWSTFIFLFPFFSQPWLTYFVFFRPVCVFNQVLSFSTGALASLFGLDMEGALLTIFFFGLLCSLPPAYFCTFGPKLGMRQMVHTRYSWGYFGASLIALLK